MASARGRRVRVVSHWIGALTLVACTSGGIVTVGVGPLAAAPTATTIDPGRLAPTSSEPATGAALASRMRVLFAALTANDVTRADTVFFPRTAYLRMKSGLLASPGADYANRLLAFFHLDVASYHRRIDTGGAPTLLRVTANPADAAWIAPGHCENLIGYWHLPGVRLVYRQGTRVWSVRVASLISWRGVWYVVHLGPNPRPRDVGTVDDFRAGAGTPGPAGGC